MSKDTKQSGPLRVMDSPWPARPRSLTERGYREHMARKKDVTIDGVVYTLQSVSPTFYMETADECGITAGKRNSAKYMDTLMKNCVISPREVAVEGIAYFDKTHDIATAQEVMREIESFLGSREKPGTGANAGATET